MPPEPRLALLFEWNFPIPSSKGSIKLPWVSFGKPAALLLTILVVKWGPGPKRKTDFTAEPRWQKSVL